MTKTEEFKKAKDLIDEKYFLEAIKILKKIQKNNGDSHIVRFELARAWATSGISIERAEKYFEKLIKDNTRISDASKVELGRINLCKKDYDSARENFAVAVSNRKTRVYSLSELAYLAIRENNFEELEKIYREVLSYDEDYWVKSVKNKIEAYIDYNLGRISGTEYYDRDYYFGKQLVDYDEDLAFDHIKRHLCKSEGSEEVAVCLEDVNVDELYSTSKTRITSINPLAVSAVDRYVVDFNRPIGRVKNEVVDCVEVVTLPNTYNVISMHPTYNYKTRVKKRS